MPVNRIVLHQSTVHPFTPVELVNVASRSGVDSIGLRVASDDSVERWWAKGIGGDMLPDLVGALLESRVTVLDVGRVELDPGLEVFDSRNAYARVLEIGSRLGAQFVSARAVGRWADRTEDLFAALVKLAGRYGMRPLLSPVPGTPIETVEQAVEIVKLTGGAVILDVSTQAGPGAEVEQAIVETGEHLGYVRVSVRELEESGGAPGLFATLPPQIPVVIGGALDGWTINSDHVDRVRALRRVVDSMLRHPRAVSSHRAKRGITT